MTARATLENKGIRRLGSLRTGFRYYQGPTKRPVRDRSELARIQKLRIPPAWTNVHIAASARVPLQAIGKDSKGRWQYLYHPQHRQRQDLLKYKKLRQFADRLPAMRLITGQHLRLPGLPREKVLAAMVRLINIAFFRVGGEQYAARHHSYGIATLRRKHVSIVSDTVQFEYTGKWGKTQRPAITDRRLRKIVQECLRLPGHEVFKYIKEDGTIADVKSHDVNQYIHEVMGTQFSAKDFRTWAGTLIAAWKLAHLGCVTEKRQAQKNVVSAIDEVASRLGNTRAIARSSYINPRVVEHYFEGSVLAHYSTELVDIIASRQRGLTRDEREVLRLLNKKLKAELTRA